MCRNLESKLFFYKSSHIQPFNHLVSEKSTNSIQPTSLYSFSSSNPEKRTQNYGLMVTWIQPELFICLLILFCFIFASSVCTLHYKPHLLFCFEVQYLLFGAYKTLINMLVISKGFIKMHKCFSYRQPEHAQRAN